jgi:hypothetical protein
MRLYETGRSRRPETPKTAEQYGREKTEMIQANNLIDKLMGVLTDYEDYRKRQKIQYPHGQTLYDTTPYGELRHYIGMEKAESKLQLVTWLFRGLDVDRIMRTARKWYARTEWQFCLSNETAEKLVKLYTKNQ